MLLASVSCTLKLAVLDQFTTTLRQMMEFLSRGQVPFSQIMQQELVLLNVLEFNVTSPTLLDFLDVLLLRAASAAAKDQPTCTERQPPGAGDGWEHEEVCSSVEMRTSCRLGQLSSFLCELALNDPEVLYGFPQPLLASAALLLASLDNPREEPSGTREAVLFYFFFGGGRGTFPDFLSSLVLGREQRGEIRPSVKVH